MCVGIIWTTLTQRFFDYANQNLKRFLIVLIFADGDVSLGAH